MSFVLDTRSFYEGSSFDPNVKKEATAVMLVAMVETALL